MKYIVRLAIRSYLLVSLTASMVLAAFSCQTVSQDAGEVPVARVHNNYLYQSDLNGIVPPGSQTSDSVAIVKRYIDNWIRQQVFLKKAEQNLDMSRLDIEKKLQDYKNSLIVFSYETELIKLQMDTVISESQIVSYYEQNQGTFRLQENIVKVLYVKVPLDAPELWRLRRLYRSEDPDDFSLLEEYCIQHAAGYLIDNDTWLFFKDVLREIPIVTSNPESYLRSNKYIELTDNYYRYFLNIKDFMLTGSPSPLVLERENIKSIILSMRKHTFINEQRDLFIQESVKNGWLETFN